MRRATRISTDMQRRLQRALQQESPRGMILLSLSWIDHILERKLAAEFSKGNRKEREALFAVGGPFHPEMRDRKRLVVSPQSAW